MVVRWWFGWFRGWSFSQTPFSGVRTFRPGSVSAILFGQNVPNFMDVSAKKDEHFGKNIFNSLTEWSIIYQTINVITLLYAKAKALLVTGAPPISCLLGVRVRPQG